MPDDPEPTEEERANEERESWLRELMEYRQQLYDLLYGEREDVRGGESAEDFTGEQGDEPGWAMQPGKYLYYVPTYPEGQRLFWTPPATSRGRALSIVPNEAEAARMQAVGEQPWIFRGDTAPTEQQMNQLWGSLAGGGTKLSDFAAALFGGPRTTTLTLTPPTP